MACAVLDSLISKSVSRRLNKALVGTNGPLQEGGVGNAVATYPEGLYRILRQATDCVPILKLDIIDVVRSIYSCF